MKNIKKSLMVMGSVAMCSFSQQTFAAATENTTTTNGDGSITVTQKIDASSTSPHYIAPSGYGFDIYS